MEGKESPLVQRVATRRGVLTYIYIGGATLAIAVEFDKPHDDDILESEVSGIVTAPAAAAPGRELPGPERRLGLEVRSGADSGALRLEDPGLELPERDQPAAGHRQRRAAARKRPPGRRRGLEGQALRHRAPVEERSVLIHP